MRTLVALFAATSLLSFVVVTGARDATAGSVFGQIYIVDTTVDDPSLTACTAAAGDCSFRGAILNANTDNNPSTVIQFQIGVGLQTLILSSIQGPLPAITGPVAIDGTTQAGPKGTVCINQVGIPCIRISGAVLPDSANGLVVQSTGVTIRGLGIIFFGESGTFFVTGGAGVRFAAGGAGSLSRSFIGTADGTTSAPNSVGVATDEGAGEVTIGGSSTTDRNVISGNNPFNVRLGGSGAVLQNNYIGLTKDGNAAMPNNSVGVAAFGDGNSIGQNGIGNVISGHTLNGVGVLGENNHIESNLIGTDSTGTMAIGNVNGVGLIGSNNFVGGDQPGQGNVISGNTTSPGAGVFAQEGHGNVIDGNLIGTNATGDAAIPNVIGVQLDFGESGITIGGDTPGSRNVISGNSDKGIFVKDAAGTVISGNYIGTNVTGDAAIPNQIGIGILDPSTNTLVGGDSANERNVISGNRSPGNGSRGILIDHAADTVVSGNYIGLDSAGTHAIFNDIGILPIDAPNLVIGGTSAGERNVISGNSTGIGTDFQNGMAIRGNYIGLNAAGTAAVPNIDWGVLFLPRETTNDNEISRNVISGNGIDGIAIQPEIDAGVGNNNSITDNIIGLSAAGSSTIPNGGAGVEIGVQGLGTTIGNTISHNSIDANAGLGIDINSDNPIPGSPMLNAAQITGGNTHVTGTISSFANQTFTIEFFASPACDPSGSGEGRDFLGVVSANTNGSGNATFNATLPPVGEGKVITATATAADGSTSEFSTCLVVVGATPTPSPTPTPRPTPGQGLLGDANCDGHVDGEDIIAALSEFADVPPGACGDLADADCNGDIEPADALRILRFLGGAAMPQLPRCADIGAPA